MSGLRDIWVDLVDKRLWPIALGLVLALVAVPVVLAKDSSTAPPPAKVLADKGPVLPGAVVDAATEQRLGLSAGKTHNPFRPRGFQSTTGASGATGATGTTGTTTTTTAPATNAAGTGPTGSSGGGTSNGSGFPAVTPAPKTETTGPKEIRAEVTFGIFGGALPDQSFPPLTALPPTGNPFLIYMGRATDHRTAIFSMAGGVTADGDGVCKPSKRLCQYIALKPGGVEDFAVKHADGKTTTYELTLLRYISK
jgi:hypothetical protein